jgi:hypothetical protein
MKLSSGRQSKKVYWLNVIKGLKQTLPTEGWVAPMTAKKKKIRFNATEGTWS